MHIYIYIYIYIYICIDIYTYTYTYKANGKANCILDFLIAPNVAVRS